MLPHLRYTVSDHTTMMFLQAAAPIAAGPSVGPLPVFAHSLMSWSGFVMALLALGMVFWRGGRYTSRLEESDQRTKERLDGFGGRLDKYEQEETARRERDAAHLAAVNEVSAALRLLTAQVGRAERGAEQCTIDTRDFAIDIGGKIDALGRELRQSIDSMKSEAHGDARKTGERLAALEQQNRNAPERMR